MIYHCLLLLPFIILFKHLQTSLTKNTFVFFTHNVFKKNSEEKERKDFH